jgi:hypothetical protein
MKGYERMMVELPQYPQIKRIVSRDQKRIYINAAADPNARIDYLLAPGQHFVIIGPGHPLPEGKET